MKRFVSCILLLVLLVACSSIPATSNPADPAVPNFKHIAVIIFENRNYEEVVGNPLMPGLNQLAAEYTLLRNYHAIGHPSLPNYLALIGGDTFGIKSDCVDCFVDAPSLPELIEASGRTWKTYQEDMPLPCFQGNQGNYVQRHNPFMYFDPIRLDRSHCEERVVPLTALQTDIQADALPNFLFITPNICNDAHDCSLSITDAWLTQQLATLVPALDETGEAYLIVIMFDEADHDSIWSKLIEPGGGRVPVILYSPLVKHDFEDASFYNHYSLLKTISAAWGLSYLGHAADNGILPITAPWK